MSQNFAVQQVPASELTSDHIETFDLTVIEAMDDCTDEQTIALIEQVRSQSLMPIQVLTVHHTGAEAAELLRIGADDVQKVVADRRIILAHSQALIRRWHKR